MRPSLPTNARALFRRPAAQDLAAATIQARAGAKGKLDAVEEERREAVKLARRTSGLYWGNYNAVCDSYERGRKLALSGWGKMQFRRHTGEGRLVNQIQGGLSVETLLTGAHSQVRTPGDATSGQEWQAGVLRMPASRRRLVFSDSDGLPDRTPRPRQPHRHLAAHHGSAAAGGRRDQERGGHPEACRNMLAAHRARADVK